MGIKDPEYQYALHNNLLWMEDDTSEELHKYIVFLINDMSELGACYNFIYPMPHIKRFARQNLYDVTPQHF